MPIGRPGVMRLMRETSLCASWALMSLCTRAMAAKAAAIAPPASPYPEGRRISTSVPSSGRARLTLAEDDFMEGKEPPDSLGDVAARESCAADVQDVLLELDRIGRLLADELLAPAGVADLTAV